MIFPDELIYSKEHTWLKMDGEFGIIGITEFAQNELGEIVYVDFPNIGTSFKMDQIFGSIEAVKTVSDLFMPVSGKVLEINTNLNQDPKLVNSSPYSDGWLMKIQLTNPLESSQLLSSASYAQITGN